MVALARAAVGVEDTQTLTRWASLEGLPGGSLGLALHRHMRANGFPLPGEPKGAPEAVMFHDLGHVLTGYGTDAPGEVRMGGFEAGYFGEDGFGVVTLALYIFHLGAPLPGTRPATGQFDLAAFHEAWDLGRRLRVDLRGFDWWEHRARPLAEVRVELGLPGQPPQA